MGRINNTERYEFDAPPSVDDYLIGTDGNTSGLVTKTFRIGDLATLLNSEGSVSNFLELTDTPSTFGAARTAPVVNAAGDALEFIGVVDIETVQTITANKTFSGNVTIGNFLSAGNTATLAGGILLGGDGTSNASDNRLFFRGSLGSLQSATYPSIGFDINGNFSVHKAGTDTENTNYTFLSNFITSPREYTWPNKSGTVALLDDVTGGSTRLTVISNSSSSNIVNVATNLLNLNIPGNTIQDGDIIRFEGAYTVSSPPNSVGLQMGTVGANVTFQNINAGTTATRINVRGYAVRQGSSLVYMGFIDLNSDLAPSSFGGSTVTDFTQALDFAFIGGGSSIPAGDVVLERGVIRLN